jgi:hypothetical protein
MTKEIFHDSDTFEVFEFVKHVHKNIQRLAITDGTSIQMKKLADKFMDDAVRILYPDDEDGTRYGHNDEAIYNTDTGI